jgi:hypothetical protein
MLGLTTTLCRAPCHGDHRQATHGDNTSDRPMWAEHGGIDFHGRACWDAWTELQVRGEKVGVDPRQDTHLRERHSQAPAAGAVLLQGMSTDQAQAKFCRVYAEAHTAERAALNFHGNHR